MKSVFPHIIYPNYYYAAKNAEYDLDSIVGRKPKLDEYRIKYNHIVNSKRPKTPLTKEELKIQNKLNRSNALRSFGVYLLCITIYLLFNLGLINIWKNAFTDILSLVIGLPLLFGVCMLFYRVIFETVGKLIPQHYDLMPKPHGRHIGRHIGHYIYSTYNYDESLRKRYTIPQITYFSLYYDLSMLIFVPIIFNILIRIFNNYSPLIYEFFFAATLASIALNFVSFLSVFLNKINVNKYLLLYPELISSYDELVASDYRLKFENDIKKYDEKLAECYKTTIPKKIKKDLLRKKDLEYELIKTRIETKENEEKQFNGSVPEELSDFKIYYHARFLQYHPYLILFEKNYDVVVNIEIVKSSRENDGSYYQPEDFRIRNNFLAKEGFIIIYFSDKQIENNIKECYQTIRDVINSCMDLVDIKDIKSDAIDSILHDYTFTKETIKNSQGYSTKNENQENKKDQEFDKIVSKIQLDGDKVDEKLHVVNVLKEINKKYRVAPQISIAKLEAIKRMFYGYDDPEHKKNFKGCIIEIMKLMGLTENKVRVINYYNEDKFPKNNAAAYVDLPVDNMPLWGSAAFNNFTITIRFRNSITSQFETFVYVIAHELSHIVLHSTKNPFKESEIATDLFVMTRGFINVMEKGRKLTRKEGTSYTNELFGYLDDANFELAKECIDKLHYRNIRDFNNLFSGDF